MRGDLPGSDDTNTNLLFGRHFRNGRVKLSCGDEGREAGSAVRSKKKWEEAKDGGGQERRRNFETQSGEFDCRSGSTKVRCGTEDAPSTVMMAWVQCGGARK